MANFCSPLRAYENLCSVQPRWHCKDDTHMSDREVFAISMAHRALEARLGLVIGEKRFECGIGFV